MAGYIGSKASVINSGVENKKVITATAGQTSFTGLTYSPNRVHVFQNGVRLVDGTDYTATNGTSLTLTVGALADDQVVVVSYSRFTVGDVVPASTGGTFSNAVTIDADGSTVLTVDRATSDGTIIDVQKSGSSVGSIGTLASGLNIGTGDTGLQFSATNDSIYPFDPSSNNIRGDFISLGDANGRFTDLYLSGGAYLGGTGNANKLEEYEEGYWLPVITYGGTSATMSQQQGQYVKIGRLVHAWFRTTTSNLNSGTGDIRLANLPITASGNLSYFHGCVQGNSYMNLPTGAGSIQPYVEQNTTTARLLYMTNTSHSDVTHSMLPVNATLFGMVTYSAAS